MEKDIAISVKNVSKTFKIPHEKVSSIRSAAVSAFSRNKGYEEFNALDDVSFEVKKGEFFGIIGRNGSGKSTLLKILAGIYQADKGSVKINGRISPFLELGIGFNPELSGRDNVYLNATVLGLTKKEIDEKFDSIVKFSELERFIDQKLKNYSSGMQVRLAFSVSIHANRDILLMDEVLAVGDMNFQSKCLEEFNKYREMGKTVLFVTHDIETVRRYCDRVMLLRNGIIMKIGKANEVSDLYIDQNMDDEEDRINDVKEVFDLNGKCANKDNKQQKKAEITHIEFFDNKNNAKNVFKTGDDISVKVYFKKKRDISILNLGIAIFNIENKCIFGTNTFINNIDTKRMIKNGYFQINYRNIPLMTDSYYMQAGLWGNTVTNRYDYFSRSKLFKMFSADDKIGIVNINYDWE